MPERFSPYAYDSVDAPTSGVRYGRPIPPGAARTGRPRATFAALLSFIWPGLGQLYAGDRRYAAIFAIPPLLVVAVFIGVLLLDPETVLISLLLPAVGMALVLFLVALALWRIAAVLHAWLRTRDKGSRTRVLSAAVVGVLVIAIAVPHAVGALYVNSIAEAAAKIFQGSRPEGADDLDQILGGQGPVAGGGEGASPVPGASGSGDSDADCVPTTTDPDAQYGDPEDADLGSEGGDEPEDPAAQPTRVPEDDIRPPDLECVPGDPGSGPGASPAPGASPGVAPPDLGIRDGFGEMPDEGPINMMFVGIDSALDRTHALTDTLIVASYDRQAGTVTMISFPRDTGRVPLYSGGEYRHRINTFLGYAGRHPELYPEGPIRALAREVGYLLGTNIHFYAATNLDGLPEIVNLVGGVRVVLEKPIADPKWNLFLQPGEYRLDGTSVMPYVRSRYGPGNSDFERARRQQQVIAALADRARDPGVAVRLPELTAGIARFARTNVPLDRLSELMPLLRAASDASTRSIVLAPNRYASRIPPEEVNGRYMIQPKLSAYRDLSLEVFGTYSRYNQ